MAIYEAERKAVRFQAAVSVDTATLCLWLDHGVAAKIVVRSVELKELEADLRAGRIDPSRQAYENHRANQMALALEQSGDMVTVTVDGAKNLDNQMWDYLHDLEEVARGIYPQVVSSEISHGAVPDNGCALVRVFSFPH